MQKPKILILLSSKCSGSSAFQSYLEKNYDAKTFEHSVHFEKETLYWTKLASVLGLPQEKMHRSQIPYSPQRAMDLLQSFLRKNGINAKDTGIQKENFFEYLFLISRRTGWYIIEKSPHHLFNESNLDLIREFRDYISGRADVYLIGLVRNPLDTIYSAWTRWGFNCRDFEYEWQKSYANLWKLKEGNTVPVTIFRYEDIVVNAMELESLISGHVGLVRNADSFVFTTKSLYRWKNNGNFCHQLREETKALARLYGYTADVLENPRKPSIRWSINSLKNSVRYLLIRTRKRLKL